VVARSSYQMFYFKCDLSAIYLSPTCLFCESLTGSGLIHIDKSGLAHRPMIVRIYISHLSVNEKSTESKGFPIHLPCFETSVRENASLAIFST
jgi:hypothetical protein